MAGRLTDLRLQSGPLGPLRDKVTIDISTDDYVRETGFICQVATAGDLDYRTLNGDSDLNETGLAVGDSVNVAGIPVILQAVRSTSTVTSIVVGIL